MNNADSELDVHWLIKMAQDIRDTEKPKRTSGKVAIDRDLAHPSLSVLAGLIDRCSFDIEPEFLRGYACGLHQAGLIDNMVLRAIEKHVGAGDDIDRPLNDENKH